MTRLHVGFRIDGDVWEPEQIHTYVTDQVAKSVDTVKGFTDDIGRDLPPDFAFHTFVYLSMHDDVQKGRNCAIEQLSHGFNMPFDRIVYRYRPYSPSDKVISEHQTCFDAGTDNLIVAMVIPVGERMEYVANFAKESLYALRTMAVN